MRQQHLLKRNSEKMYPASKLEPDQAAYLYNLLRALIVHQFIRGRRRRTSKAKLYRVQYSFTHKRLFTFYMYFIQ